MKRILTLTLIMAVAAMAGSVDFDVTSPDATTVEIAYTGSVVGMAIDVDCSDTLEVESIDSMPAFFDVYMDSAYDEEVNGDGYTYGEGTAVASQDAAGPASLPAASFCISAGGLEDDETDTVPADGTIVMTVSGEGTLTISENTLRGGVVDYDGAMTVTYTSDNVAIAAGDSPAQEEWDTLNVNGDDYVNSQDVADLVGYINTNGSFPAWSVAIDGTNDYLDLNADGYINSQDVADLVGYINTNGSFPAWSVTRPTE